MTQSSVDTTPGGAAKVQGNIAARIDRLPLTRIQYLLGAITQIYWGLLIDTDGLVSKLYPFVWEPLGMSTFQFSLLIAANTGAGILIGINIGGPLSDKYGRKKILVMSSVITAAFLWPIAQTNVFGWLLLFNVLYGIGLGFMLATNNVYLQEIAPPASRQKLTMRCQLLTAVCSFLPGILGVWFIPDNYEWYIYVLAFGQLAICLPLGLMLPESPRWLEQKGRVAEADAIVSRWETKIEARFGPLPAPDTERHVVVQTKKVPAKEVFTGIYGKRTIILLIVWGAGYASIVYGKSTYLTTYLVGRHWSADEVFLWTSIIGAAVRVCAFFLNSLTGERFERHRMVAFIGILWGVLMLGFLLFPDAKGLQMFLVVVTTPLSSLWLFNMYNYTGASYPTRIRSVGYSLSNGIGHTAAVWAPLVIAPIFAATADSNNWGWFVWLLVLGVGSSILIGLTGSRQKGKTLEEMST